MTQNNPADASLFELERLRKAANALRDAQIAYMADRGNDELGKVVGQRAQELDEVLGRSGKHEMKPGP